MTNVINITKKAFTWSVVVMTIAWSMGLAALAPLAANAATCSPVAAGDIIQSAGSNAVWIVTSDLKRMAFPNSHVYHSWFADFSALQVLPVECYSNVQAASQMVKYRPGSFPVRFDGNNRVYVVGENGMLHWVKDGAFLTTLYGANALKPIGAGGQLVGILPIFESSYPMGAELDTLKLHNGMLVKVAGSSDVWAVMGDKLHKVTGTLPSFVSVDVRTVSQALVDALEVGADVTAASITADPTQGASSGTPGETPVVDGDLSLSLAASSPASMDVPANAIGVVYTSINLKNTGSTAVDVTGVTIQRTGLGNYQELDKVYVEVDGVRKGSKRTLGSDNEVEIFFSTAQTKITVPAGKTVRMDLVADMNGSYTTTYGKHALRATAVQVASGVDVTASFPITGSQMSRSSATVSEVVFEYESVNDEVEVGEDAEVVAKFNLDPQDSDDVTLRRIVLENTGTADAEDVSKLELYRGSTRVAGPVDMVNDRVAFELTTPFLFEDGDDYSFEVRADIENGANSTLQFELDEATDAYIYEVLNGFRAAVSSTLGGTVQEVSITAGDLVINEASDNPKAETIAAGAEDVLLLAAEIRAESQPLTITDFTLDITKSGGSSAYADLENVTVKLGTMTVAGPTDASAATLAFDDEFEVSGVKILYVYADISEDAVAGSVYTVSLDNSNVTAEELDGDAISSSDITGNAQGNNQTIGASTLSVTKDITYGNESVVAGADSALIGRYVVRAPTAEGIELEEVNVYFGWENAGGASEVSDDTFSGLRVSIDNEEKNTPNAVDLAGGATAVTSTGSQNDFSVDTEVAADSSIVVSVYVDIDSNTTFHASDYVQTAISFTYRGMVSDARTTQDADDAVAGQQVQLDSGALTISAKTLPKSNIVIANGTSEVFVGEFEFDADNDDYTLTDLDFFVSNTPAGVKALRITNNKNSDTTTVTSVDSNNEMLFNNLSIPVKDGEANTRIKLYAVFNDVESAAVASGDIVQFELIGAEADPASGGDSTVYDDNDDYRTQQFVLRATRPTIVATAGDQTDGSDQLRSGDVEMIDLVITADQAGDVILDSLTLNITGTTTAVTSLELWDEDGEVLISTSTIASGSNVWDISSIVEEISSGSSKSYTLVLVTSGIAAGDELIMKLTDFGWQDDDEDNTVADGTYVTGIPTKTFTADRDA